MIRIVGGTVLSPEGMVTGDVWVDGGHVADVGRDVAGTATRLIDATGMLVGPGLVDLHTHLREPGHTWKEDIASGSEAAAAGGFTAVVAMPNTDPPIDTPHLVDLVRKAGDSIGLVRVEVAAALTVGRRGDRPSDMAALHRDGVHLFTDDGDCVADAGVLAEVMRRASRLPGVVVAQHAEDPVLSGGGHMHLGEISTGLGVPGIPPEAESEVVERDIALAEATGARYHVLHVSSAKTVKLIRNAKARGAPVTAEVTPHHLTFDDTSLSTLDPDLKMYPPIRGLDDRDALREALVDGTIDVVATDHAPHASAEKGVGFLGAPRGVIGLETAASAVWEVLGDPVRFFEVLSVAPARILGITRHGLAVSAGSPANLVIFDPTQKWFPGAFRSRSSNSPYREREMAGRVVATIFEGAVTHELEKAR